MSGERSSIQVRTFTFEIAGRAESDGAIPVVVSSDAVVEMPDGPEVLVHTREAVDLQRAPLPIIATHKGGQVNVGVIDALQVAAGKLRGLARFGTRTEAREYAADVINGIIRSVSVGYARIKAHVRTDGVLVTTRWMPSHAALIAEPADVNAGFFRELQILPELQIETAPAEPATAIAAVASRAAESKADDESTRTVSQPAAPAASPEKPTMGDTQAAAGQSAEEQARQAAQAEANVSAVDREKTRIRAIEALGKANSIDGRKVEGWIRSGTTLDKIADEILAVHEERGKARPTSAADLGLSRSEQQRYSVFRLMRLMSARPAEVGRLQEEAAYEIECSRGVAKRLGRDPDGFFVPGDILRRPIDPEAAAIAAQRHNRAMTVVPGASGGYLVETENMGFIEILRNTMVLSAMGARQLSGLVGNITVPRQTAGTSVTWQAGETASATATDQTLGQLSMTPKTAIIVTEVGRTLMLQSNPSAESMVMADLAQSTAIGVDYAGINGTGGAQPVGILQTSGITTGQSASTATQAKLLAFQSVAASANALLGRPGYVARPAGAAVLAGRPRFTNSDTPMWDGNILRGTVAGFPAMSSMQMPADASLLFGSWDSVVVGEWGVLELSLNPYQNFNAGVVGIRAIYSVDVMVRYPQAFVYSSDLS